MTTSAHVQPPAAGRTGTKRTTTRRRTLARPPGWTLAVVPVLVAYVLALQLGAHTVFGADAGSVNNRLAQAFLDGRTDLGIRPPKGLLALSNPYDERSNAAYRTAGLHDLSLYHGKIYSYWGPVPTLLLFVPVRAVGGVLAQGWAVLAFTAASFLLSVALLALLAARMRERPPGWMLAVATVALGAVNLGPYLITHPLQYEVAIAGGTFFTVATVLALGIALTRGAAWPLALASLCAGLAMGCRPTTALLILACLVVAVVLGRAAAGRRERLRVAAAALVPFGVVAAGLLAYNAARFGSPAEFGRRWQLSADDFSTAATFTTADVLPNLWYYLLPPPLLRAQFPFLIGNPGRTYPFDVAAGYTGTDAVVGVLVLVPLLALAPLAPRLLRRGAPELRRSVAALAALGTLLLAPLLPLFGAPAAVRYQADFLPFWAIAAVATWLAVARRRLARLAGAAALVWTAVLVLALAADNNHALYDDHQGAFRTLQDATSPLATGAAMLAGAPILSAVGHSGDGPPYRYDRLGVAGARTSVGRDPVTITVVSPDARAAELVATLRARDGASGVRVSSPAGGRTGAPARGRPQRIRVRLRRGINRLSVAASGPGSVELDGLRVDG